MVISLYLWTKEGLSKRNLDLLQELAKTIRGLKSPWIIGGDFQVSPHVLASSGWLALAEGVVVAPTAPTCGANTIDYFVVAEGLEHVVLGISVLNNAVFSPHSPVRLLLQTAPRKIQLRRFHAPSKIEADLPTGCLNRTTPVQGLSTHTATIDELDSDYEAWLKAAELTWDGIKGINSTSTRSPSRAVGPQFRWRPALGKIGTPHAHASAASRLWRTIASKLIDCAWPARTEERGKLGKEAERLAAERAWRQLKTMAAPRHTDGDGIRECREWLFDNFDTGTCNTRACIELHVTAEKRATNEEARSRRNASAAWRLWLKEGPADGLSRQHRFSRTPQGWLPDRVASPCAGSPERYDNVGDEIQVGASDLPQDDPPCRHSTVPTRCTGYGRRGGSPVGGALGGSLKRRGTQVADTAWPETAAADDRATHPGSGQIPQCNGPRLG